MTPFDMGRLNDLDRFHLVIDVIDRFPGLAGKAGHIRQLMTDNRLIATAHTREHGEELAARECGVVGCGTRPGSRDMPQRLPSVAATFLPASTRMTVAVATSWQSRRISDSPVSALSRAWCAGSGGRIQVPLPVRHGAEPCCRTCRVRWPCEMSLSRRSGAGGLGRLTM